ncbi:MAG: class I SAM-dependent methyltransferase [Candidatus Obscuribacterales bacterium]|nr:class I SAM-dependent methyltransferase [Candidatus Obscuribacterales bacterium]
MNVLSIPQLFAKEGDTRVSLLRTRLDDFYARENYPAFHGANDQGPFWQPIKAIVAQRLAKRNGSNDKLRILEIGAGCTNFANFLGELRQEVEFHVQDITDRNVEYLNSQADHVHIMPITSLSGSFDIIFATFVWEHITNPRACLDHLLSLTSAGGSLILASPRYDFPFYISPSSRHLAKWEQIAIGCWIAWKRLVTMITWSPQFLIHLEPAILHMPWFCDADAVHWVSFWDLRLYLRGKYNLRQIPLSLQGYYGQIWETLCLLFVEIRKQ